MAKANKAPAETPETEWPETGGSYVRDAQTGQLTKSDPTAGGVSPADTNEPPEDLNHGT